MEVVIICSLGLLNMHAHTYTHMYTLTHTNTQLLSDCLLEPWFPEMRLHCEVSETFC